MFLFLDEAESTTSSEVDKLSEFFSGTNMYIILGAFVGLILVWYLIKRYYRTPLGKVAVITKRGNIVKIMKEGEARYLIPFVEGIGAILSLEGNTFSSDNLQVNEGPDKLYKINFTLKYDITDVTNFYNKCNRDLNRYLTDLVNESLRSFVYNGNGDSLLRKYKENESEIVREINKSITDEGLVITSFKVNTILLVNGK